jgi:hypothetical protein
MKMDKKLLLTSLALTTLSGCAQEGTAERGWPWWAWLLLILALAIIIYLLIKATGRT